MKAFRSTLLYITIAFILTACSRPFVLPWHSARANPSITVEPPAPENPVAEETAPPALAWPAIAIIKAGANPLWFEFVGPGQQGSLGPLGSAGPRLIASPVEAALIDYAPWPHARFCVDTLAVGQSLVMAINRTGFLIAAPDISQDSLILYQVEDSTNWGPYSVASIFMYDEKPAALLYRDDFFAEPAAFAPEYQVLFLSEETPRPLGAQVPALNALPKEQGWEANALRLGPEGFWYYRFGQPGNSQGGTAYYRTRDLSLPGEKISQGEYRNSSRPETALGGLALISRLIAAIQQNANGLSGILLQMTSPDFSGTRLFSASADASEQSSLFFGYYSGVNSGPALAFAVSANGRGFAIRDEAFFSFELPRLPQGFVYTGAGLAGHVLIASWEEQEEFSIGAAGFMVIDAKALGL